MAWPQRDSRIRIMHGYWREFDVVCGCIIACILTVFLPIVGVLRIGRGGRPNGNESHYVHGSETRGQSRGQIERLALGSGIRIYDQGLVVRVMDATPKFLSLGPGTNALYICCEELIRAGPRVFPPCT